MTNGSCSYLGTGPVSGAGVDSGDFELGKEIAQCLSGHNMGGDRQGDCGTGLEGLLTSCT